MIKVFSAIKEAMQRRRELTDLERLSDLELRDMGLNRSELYYRIMHKS
jgi:hypothetical protein